MNNEKIERLDVTAIGDRVRLRELCKEDGENNSRSSMYVVRDERMRLFILLGPRSQSKSISVACFSI